MDKKLDSVLKEKAIFIFDFDGTIINHDTVFYFLNTFYQTYGNVNCSNETFLDTQYLTGYQLYERMCKELNLTNMSWDEFREVYTKIVSAYAKSHEQKYFKYIDVLIKKYKNAKFVLLSNGMTEHLTNQLKKFGLIDHFYSVMGCASMGLAKEDVYCDTKKWFGVKQDKCVVFEDAQRYLDLAKKYNITTVGIEHKYNSGLITADFLIKAE